MAIPDAGATLMMQGTYNSAQSFPAILAYPRQLPTAEVTISLQSPPTGTATFVIETASTSGGTFREIARLAWPSGFIGSQNVPLGVSSSAAWRQNNQAQWLRLSLATTGALTGSAWLGKPGGAVGVGAGPNQVLTGTAA
jgi:hypothetical protein